MKNKRVESQEYLKHVFTPSERENIAEEMARAFNTKDRAQHQLKAVQAQFKSDIESADNTVGDCARKLNNGFEMREMPVILSYDFETNTLSIFRADTEELVRQRELTPEERQLEL